MMFTHPNVTDMMRTFATALRRRKFEYVKSTRKVC